MKKIIFIICLTFSLTSCRNEKKREITPKLVHKNVDLNDKYVDFSMKDENRKTRWVSDLRDEYTLLEFWSSSCTPCRMQNRELAKVYEKYHSKGFEIISVSLDKNKKEWLKAIKKDKLKWKNLNNLKGWKSPVFKSYYDRGIPFSYLIAPNGKIIGKQLHPKSLSEALEILIDKKGLDRLPYIRTRKKMYTKKIDTLIYLKKASL